MANRSILAKKLKIKRGHGKNKRYARFSGDTAKYAVRVDYVLEHIDEDKTRLKAIEIPVGPIHLSRQVVSTGSGPNPERMQQYYNTVASNSFKEPLPERSAKQMAAWLAQYENIVQEIPFQNRVTLAKTEEFRLDMFFTTDYCFLVEINYREQYFQRSRDYDSRQSLMDRLKNRRISWISRISSE